MAKQGLLGVCGGSCRLDLFHEALGLGDSLLGSCELILEGSGLASVLLVGDDVVLPPTGHPGDPGLGGGDLMLGLRDGSLGVGQLGGLALTQAVPGSVQVEIPSR